MNIRSFRIRNYRSIVDSGTCSLASDVTILAGKNESGKTSILHALRDFDADVAAFDQATRIQEPTGPTSVEIVFALDAATVKEVCSEALLKPTLKLKASLGDFALRKETDGTYHITEELAESIRQAREAYTADLLDSRLQGLLSEVSSVGVSVEPVGPYSSETHSQYVSIVKQVESQLPHVSADVRKELQAVLAGAKSLLSTSQTEPEEAFINAILEELPSFIYFDNFEHLLPFEIALSESPKHPAIRDFATVAGLSLETLLSTADTQKRKNLISRHAAIVDGDFRNAWHQDSVTLTADVDGQQLLMGVREQGGTELFKLTQRSKGLQWFLSFFLCLKAQRGAQSVVLVDEPGLYLHAKAQEDVLAVLEQLAAEMEVIFSTHSPYLIDPQRLDRVRLVEKGDQDTRIEERIHRGADPDTLTPVLTRIGASVNHLDSGTRVPYVILEGMSDWYYLQAFRKLIPDSLTPHVRLVGATGAAKAPVLVSLFLAWDLEFIVALDNDREGKRQAKKLIQEMGVDETAVLRIGADDERIEDLFTRTDFSRYVLEDDSESGAPSNSTRMKAERRNKVLSAKRFFDRARSGDSQLQLEAGTKQKFGQLLSLIADRLSKSAPRHQARSEADLVPMPQSTANNIRA